ncbi:MAG: DnaD domain protein [Tissierellia bacterium]|nr:DnaD domain protein [Tissierellia bacterium]
MKVKIEKMKLDMGSTPIENMFINSFMRLLDELSLKVFLLMVKKANDTEDIDLYQMAGFFNVDKKSIEEAIETLRNYNLISIKKYNYGNEFYEINSLRQAYFGGETNETEETNNKDIIDRSMSMFNNIEDIIKRSLTPAEITRINETMDDINIAPELITEAFKQAKEKKGNVDPKYALAFAVSWRDKGIHSLKELKEYELSDNSYSKSPKKYTKKKTSTTKTNDESGDSITERFRKQRAERRKKQGDLN